MMVQIIQLIVLAWDSLVLAFFVGMFFVFIVLTKMTESLIVTFLIVGEGMCFLEEFSQLKVDTVLTTVPKQCRVMKFLR
jgi:hypothetical protein